MRSRRTAPADPPGRGSDECVYRSRPEIRHETGSGRGAFECCRAALLIAGLALAMPLGVTAQPELALEEVLNVEPDPSGCITERSLGARVQRWLGDSPPHLPHGLQLNVSIDPLSYQVDRGGRMVAERKFEGLRAGCSDRLDALAVAIAVVLEHLAGAPSAATPSTTGAALERAEASTPAMAPEPSRAGPSFALFARAGVLFEPLPAPAFGFGAGFELGLEGLSFALVALATAETDTPLAGGRSEGQLVGGQVLGCLPWSLADLELSGCAGCAGGVVMASGRDYSTRRRAAMGWIAPFLRVSARYPAQSWLSLRLALEGMVNVLRPELQVRGAATSDRTGPFGGAGSLELVVALP